MSSSGEFIVWEPECTRRGTFSIIITCLTTLGICVWSCLHLNIPKDRPTWQRNLARKIVWMSIGVLLPEYLILVAFCKYLSAREIRDKANERLGFYQAGKRRQQRLERGESKAEYLLSGFREAVARDSESTQDFSSGEDKYPFLQDEITSRGLKLAKWYLNELCLYMCLTSQQATSGKFVHQWTLVHGFYAAMGGFVHQTPDGSGGVTHTVISPQGFVELLEKRPDLIPDVSEESICDKSKSNGLAKALLIAQVSWFCISCITRLAQRLPLTLLEISTAAHATCSLFVYGLWWHKPLDVAGVTLVPYAGVHLKVREEGLLDAEGDDSTDEVDETASISVFIFMMVGIIYGAPHFLAWSSSFPTHAEQLLWRICTCTVVGAPILSRIFLLFTLRRVSDSVLRSFWIASILPALVYFPANLYLIAASLRQLFHLPPEAFKLPVWLSYVPHFS